ncbi:unnamed protein product [Rangifer tarandus platyrhynchus]|uniref:Uncharacterized protein n=1 Tax=Rangifer tarandus platyrhynchus TaxID=3082113 RepID=A0AC59YVG2_RANTA
MCLVSTETVVFFSFFQPFCSFAKYHESNEEFSPIWRLCSGRAGFVICWGLSQRGGSKKQRYFSGYLLHTQLLTHELEGPICTCTYILHLLFRQSMMISLSFF